MTSLTNSREWHQDCEKFMHACEYCRMDELRAITEKYFPNLDRFDQLATFSRSNDMVMDRLPSILDIVISLRLISFKKLRSIGRLTLGIWKLLDSYHKNLA